MKKNKFISLLKALMLCFSVLFTSLTLYAQNITVKGKIIDTNNEPIIGATIIVEGDVSHGTITDMEGNFSLTNVPSNAALQITYVGMQSQIIAVNGRDIINVVMETDAELLDELVVIGYGTRLKGELTGSVSKVDNSVFESRPLTNTMNALQGALPGVIVTRGSGKPGRENYSLQIRGASSMSGSKTLVLIDGIPGDLSLINPNDIADITVLKDAAASIYGARAADGVVLVTTKKGLIGAPSVSYSGNFGIKKPQFLKKMANTLQYAEMYDQGMRNVNLPGLSQEIFDKIKANAEPDPEGWLIYLENFPGFYGSHVWNDAVFGTGVLHAHNLSISGGSDNNSYLFSAGYQMNEGVFKHGDNYSERYNLRMNYDFKLSNKINIETRTSFEVEPTVEPSALGGILYFVHQQASYVPIYNPLGQFYKYQGGFRNPVQYLEEAGKYNTNTTRFSTNVRGNLQLYSDLKLVGQAGITMNFNDGKRTNPTFPQYKWDGTIFDIVNVPNSASFSNSKSFYQNYTAYLDYNKVISNKHRFNAMAGASRENNVYQSQSITGYNFASNEIFTLNLADKTKTEYANFTGSEYDWALQSFFGRLSYSLNGKYLVDFSTRMDGSSKFAKNKRWSALFPSLAVAWNLSEENFIKSLNVFDELKARLSWGQSGNQELSFGNYDYISLITISGNYPMGIPNVGLPGAVSSIASENRTWETIETKNIGIDFAIFRSKLSGSFDYYIKNNKNMLVNEQLPATLGGTSPTQNIGHLETKGWDFMIRWNDKAGDFKYGVSFIINDSKNKLIKLRGSDSFSEGLVYAREGYALNSYFGYQFDGIIQNEDQLASYKKLGNLPAKLNLGDVMFRDVDGDGKITAFGDPAAGTKGDIVYLGNLNPRYSFSSNINLSYKGFDLNVLLQGIGKREGVRTGEFSYPLSVVWEQPLLYYVGKNWTSENTAARYPRVIPGAVGNDELRNWNWRYSSMRMNNLAYLKLKDITLAYNIPQTLVSKVKMQNIRVYISGQDLLTFSKDTWENSFNPEETWERSDEQTYPFNSLISIGLDIKF